MNKNRGTFAKIFVGGLLFLTVLITSEIIYLAKNRPQSLGAYFLYPAKWIARSGNTEKSLNFIKKGVVITTYLNSLKYPQVAPSGNLGNIKIEHENFNNKYLEMISQLNVYEIISLNNTDLSKTLYTLSLLAYSENEINLAADFLTFATFTNPQLSHYHVELANLYLMEKDIEATKKVLERCEKLEFPKTHCKQFEESNLLYNVSEPVGFLKGAVEKHYQSL